MSYPRVERIVDSHKNEIILNFYSRNQAIEFDKDLCVGCYVCSRVCPQEAIKQYHHELIKKKTEDLCPDIPDAEKCSYCGTCAYMCPFSAITLKKDGVPVALDEIEIVKRTTGNIIIEVKKVISAKEILAFQELVRKVPIADNVLKYAVRLVGKTRPKQEGASEYVKQYLR